MKFALNYSPQALELVKTGRITLDLFKCPAWPDLIEALLPQHPLYIHFPLGAGAGNIWDGGAKQNADWEAIEALLQRTNTFYVNLHSTPQAQFFPDLPAASLEPAAVRRVTAALIRDVEAASARFGADRVIFENNGMPIGAAMWAHYLPEVISAVVEGSGCGFLFDISHARQAARHFGWDVQDYIARLPVQHTREIHITGIQTLGEAWVARLRRHGVREEFIARNAGQWTDHLPLVEEDWEFMDWAAAQVAAGAWGRPQIVAVECGGDGVGSFWQATTDAEVLAAQIPRLRRLFNPGEG